MDVMVWIEDFDPGIDGIAPAAGISGVTLHPVEAVLADGGRHGADAALTTRPDARVLEDIALAGLRRAADRLGDSVEVELACPPSTARAHHSIVGFAEAAQRIHERVAIGLPYTRATTSAVEELAVRGLKTTVEIWHHDDLFPLAKAFTRGLERRARLGGSLIDVTSVSWFRVAPLHDVAAGRLDGRSIDAPSIVSAAAQACYLTATRLFQGDRWRALRELGASSLRPGFRSFDGAHELAPALALPGAAVAVRAPSLRDYVQEVDETTVAWVLAEAARHGVDVQALGAELRERASQTRAFLERTALARITDHRRADEALVRRRGNE
jgi:hypothetical protein